MGVATTGISLVRENTEAIRPPRALWVPFALGRPFGAANDAEFQRGVLSAALALLERGDGPVILEDYPLDAPEAADCDDMEGMVCPVRLARPKLDAPSDLVSQVGREMAQLAPWREAFLAQHGRTIVGISGMAIDDVVAMLGGLVESGRCDSVAPGMLGAMVRHATEDLRNWYIEAASARPGGAAGAERLADWFWGETAAGGLILAVHPVALSSEDEGLRQVALRALIPRTQQHRLKRPPE